MVEFAEQDRRNDQRAGVTEDGAGSFTVWMSLEQAKSPDVSATTIVRRRRQPDRKNRPELLAHRWQFWRPRPAMRRAVAGKARFICSTLTGKRLLFVWADASWCPSNAVGVLDFDDDYAMGVLTSRAHGAWAWARSSTFKQDLRYTPSTAFETFPWPPTPSPDQRESVAAAGRDVLAVRPTRCSGRARADAAVQRR